jgi:outer membrane protein assembly factor BamB
LIMGSSPAIAEDGTIYIGSWDTKLYAINPNGTLKWKSKGVGGSIYSSPAIADDGTIYVGTMSSGNFIVAVNPNGTIKWSYKTGDSITSDPAIADDGTVYIGSQDDYLYAMWPNGTLRWRFGTGSMIMGPPSIADDGTIYIASWDDYLYALYPNGTRKWKYKIGVGSANNPSIASDGTIYVGHDALYAVNPDGTGKWKFSFGSDRLNYASSYAISSDGTIYFGVDGNSYGGEIIAVNPDGTEKWRKKIANKWVKHSPSIAEDGTVYIGSAHAMDRGYLHAFGNVESNSPPDAPSISGQTQGKVGEEYRFTLRAVDPDNNPICLFVDWDDGDSGWVDWYASGEQDFVYHTWTTQGDYTIKAKVKDVFDEESDWATFDVKIERKSREVQQMLFYRLLEHFPKMFPILRQLLRV